MAHPHVGGGALRERRERPDGLEHVDARRPELAVTARSHPAPEQLRHQLQPVADAEHGNAELEQRRVAHRSALLLDARGPSAEDDALRAPRFDVGGAEIGPLNLAVDVELADSARDELRVLAAEIEDEYALFGH